MQNPVLRGIQKVSRGVSATQLREPTERCSFPVPWPSTPAGREVLVGLEKPVPRAAHLPGVEELEQVKHPFMIIHRVSNILL